MQALREFDDGHAPSRECRDPGAHDGPDEPAGASTTVDAPYATRPAAPGAVVTHEAAAVGRSGQPGAIPTFFFSMIPPAYRSR